MPSGAAKGRIEHGTVQGSLFPAGSCRRSFPSRPPCVKGAPAKLPFKAPLCKGGSGGAGGGLPSPGISCFEKVQTRRRRCAALRGRSWLPFIFSGPPEKTKQKRARGTVIREKALDWQVFCSAVRYRGLGLLKYRLFLFTWLMRARSLSLAKNRRAFFPPSLCRRPPNLAYSFKFALLSSTSGPPCAK